MVSASDTDETAELVYSIDKIKAFDVDGDDVEGNFTLWFWINQTGGLFTGTELNREEITSFIIPIIVEDVNATENTKPQTAKGE